MLNTINNKKPLFLGQQFIHFIVNTQYLYDKTRIYYFF